MKFKRKSKNDINVYIMDREYTANTYVMRCQDVFMLLHIIVFVLDMLGIFIVDKSIMITGFVPVVFIYVLLYCSTKKITLSDSKTKYFILFCVVLSLLIVVGFTPSRHSPFFLQIYRFCVMFVSLW